MLPTCLPLEVLMHFTWIPHLHMHLNVKNLAMSYWKLQTSLPLVEAPLETNGTYMELLIYKKAPSYSEEIWNRISL